MSFSVEYNWDNAAPPRLRCNAPIKYKTLHYLQHEIEQEEVKPGEWLGIHPTQGLVTFRAWDNVENKWFSSRPGAFNTEDESIAIVECPVGITFNCHWTLTHLRAAILFYGQDIRFLKVRVGQYIDRGEIYYIPYEPDFEIKVREKLARQHGYYTVLEAVS
jgi:hypothetical protein